MQERRTAPALSEPGGDTGSTRGPGGRPERRDAARRAVLASAVAAVVVTADQLTKSWAVHRLSSGPIHVVWKLDLALTYNSGSAFSLLQGWAPVLVGVAVVAVAAMAVSVRHARSTLAAVALGLVSGGALGNLLDRLVRGHHGAVVDFVDLHFWPTFNLADSCIVVGTAMLAVALWRGSPESGAGGRARPRGRGRPPQAGPSEHGVPLPDPPP